MLPLAWIVVLLCFLVGLDPQDICIVGWFVGWMNNNPKNKYSLPPHDEKECCIQTPLNHTSWEHFLLIFTQILWLICFECVVLDYFKAVDVNYGVKLFQNNNSLENESFFYLLL